MSFPENASFWQLADQQAAGWMTDNRRELVRRAMDRLQKDRTLSAAATAELRWVVDYNVALFIDLLANPHNVLDEATGSDLVASAANRAAEGSQIESLLDDYVTGTAAIWQAMNELLGDRAGPDFGSVTVALFEYLRQVVILVARGFQHEASRVSADRRDARFVVYSALIDGSDAVQVASRAAIPLASHYLVLALRFGASGAPVGDGRSAEVPRLRRLNEAKRVLDSFAEGDVLSLIGDPSGIALVPMGASRAVDGMADVAAVASRLAEAVGAPVHLGAAFAPVTDIPKAIRLVEEVLELVTAIGWASGAWRLEDVLIPYQLTRPGPARDALAERLAILDDHPDWELTIRTYLAAGSDRNRAAEILHLHPNTIDYRLRRFAESTGLDAGNRALAPTVQAAVWVRDLARQAEAAL